MSDLGLKPSEIAAFQDYVRKHTRHAFEAGGAALTRAVQEVAQKPVHEKSEILKSYHAKIMSGVG